MTASFLLALLAALPDALFAVWLMLLGKGLLTGDARLVMVSAVLLGVSAAATWFLVVTERAPAAALPRQGDDRARGARGAAPGQGRDDRPPGAARVPRPALGAPQPGVRARPHVHVGLLDLRLAAAPRRRDRDPGPRASRARAARPVRRPHRADLELAARRRARRRGTRRVVEPDRAPSLRARGQRAAREGGARRADRRAPDPRAARGMGDLVPPGRAGAQRERPLARARVGRLRRRLRRRDRVRGRGPPGAAGDGAARARGRLAAVGVRQRRGRRDRLPARDLDRRLTAPRLARGLRGLASWSRRIETLRRGSTTASGSRACRSPIPAPSGSCSRAST